MTDARGRASGAGGLVGARIGNEELHDWTRGARREMRAQCACLRGGGAAGNWPREWGLAGRACEAWATARLRHGGLGDIPG